MAMKYMARGSRLLIETLMTGNIRRPLLVTIISFVWLLNARQSSGSSSLASAYEETEDTTEETEDEVEDELKCWRWYWACRCA